MSALRKYRVVTHAHSTWSYDGSWRIAALAEKLSSYGVDILMMSEHSQRFDHARLGEYLDECRAASTDKIRVIPGIEYSTPKNEIHILTWGLDHYLGEELEVEAILDAVDQQNGIAIFAHPSRRNVWKKFKASWAEKLYGMEIWNRKSDGLAHSEQACELIKQHGLRPLVSLDFHRAKQFYPLYNVLQTDRDIEQLSDGQLIDLIGQTTMQPKFLGLPTGLPDNNIARMTHALCFIMKKLHRLVFSAKR